MINAIIYSKDRAAQLHLLLDSIFDNAPGIFNINILYTFSNDEFKQGYDRLINRMSMGRGEIKWILETDFRKQNIDLIKSDYEYTCFFTDDDIIYEKFDEKIITDVMEQDSEIFCFSLRLGKNIKVCYTMKSDNILVPLYEDDKIVKWNWSVHYLDFGYPLSVDGHIFRTHEISKLSGKVSYINPNTFEAALQAFDSYPRENMAAFIHSKLVNTPSNIVQQVYPNRQGEKFGITAKELNDKYLKGTRIDSHQMLHYSDSFKNVIGCHQEIELIFGSNIMLDGVVC